MLIMWRAALNSASEDSCLGLLWVRNVVSVSVTFSSLWLESYDEVLGCYEWGEIKHRKDGEMISVRTLQSWVSAASGEEVSCVV